VYETVACRIDRSRWNPFVSLADKVDAHLLNNAYKRSEWDKLKPLLTALYGNTPDSFDWSLKYYEKFTELNDKL